MKFGFLRSVGAVSAIAMSAVLTSPLTGADKTARVDSAPVSVYTYSTPSGESYFAIAAKAHGPSSADATHEHIVLVDTSASQTGDHRTQSLAVTKELLSSLPQGDRVMLLSVDVSADRLTDGFVAPQSDAAVAAFEKLESRAPLGATNLLAGLRTAAASVEDAKPASIVYIGDGMSVASLIRKPEMRELLAEFRARKITVNSYAVGPKVDLTLLGVLAQQTGGIVRFDNSDAERDEPHRVARDLAAASIAAVVYPAEVGIEPADGLKLIAVDTPLRADRSTFYFGTGKLPASLTVNVDGDKYEVASSDYRATGAHLGTITRQSAAEEGFVAAAAGIEMFAQAEKDIDNRISALLENGKAAVTARNFDAVDAATREIQNLDPANVRAKALNEAAGRLKNVELAQETTPAAPPAPPKPAIGAAPAAPQSGPPTDDALTAYEKLKKVKGDQMTLEVSRTIENARRLGSDDPDGTISELKRAEGAVRAATDIDPDVRDSLTRRLQTVMADVRASKEVNDLRKVKQAEVQAAIESQKRLVDKFLRDEERMTQLIDQCRALMWEGILGRPEAFEEAEAVARIADDVRPGSAVAAAAIFTAEAAGQLDKAYRLRALRADKFLETLYQVELSHVPFPDEPPIVWPNAQVWRALSQRRAKWDSVDLRKNSPAEEHIESVLDDLTQVNFTDTPLTEAMQFLASLHNYTVLIETPKLEEAAIATDTPINQTLSGITLRSALKILLEPLQLTYVIEDEVMKITTIEAANEKLTTRVYPVGDLVIQLQAGGGMMGGGMMGGGMGGMGGMGGGGMGMGGGGMGMFNVPATPRAKRPAAANKPEVADPEVRGLLKGIMNEPKADKAKTSQIAPSKGQSFAQVRDGEAAKSLKKKPQLAR